MKRICAWLSRRLVRPGEIQRGNCLLVLFKYFAEGGWLIVRPSLWHASVPHLMWSGDLITVLHFRPLRPRSGPCAVFHALWHRGEWKREPIDERDHRGIR